MGGSPLDSGWFRDPVVNGKLQICTQVYLFTHLIHLNQVLRLLPSVSKFQWRKRDLQTFSCQVLFLYLDMLSCFHKWMWASVHDLWNWPAEKKVCTVEPGLFVKTLKQNHLQWTAEAVCSHQCELQGPLFSDQAFVFEKKTCKIFWPSFLSLSLVELMYPSARMCFQSALEHQ